jgi:hypothetical protein
VAVREFHDTGTDALTSAAIIVSRSEPLPAAADPFDLNGMLTGNPGDATRRLVPRLCHQQSTLRSEAPCRA